MPDDVPTTPITPRVPPQNATVRPSDTAGGSAPQPAAGDPGREVAPGYRFVRELGRGGMGVVYLVRDEDLGREVALKTLSDLDGAGPSSIARFWAEAEVMAAVKHPNVVQVYDLGEHGGRPFMVMEYVPGGSLAAWLRGRPPLTPQVAASLVEQIARGVAAAHELGIVHRDLKPGNVLLGNAECGVRNAESNPGPGSSNSAFRTPHSALLPKVADFGLAKRRTNDLTRTQALLGTPAYMAPEQAAGRAKFVGPQADVWALGVILYECLSGSKPFAGETFEVLFDQIRTADPVPLRRCARGVSRDLDTIVAKCLSKEPEGRYATASDLADDLGRFGRGEPILARPLGAAGRFARWVRRNPAVAGLTAAVFLALAAGAAVSTAFALSYRDKATELDTALTEKTRTAGELGVSLERQKRTGEELADALKLSGLREGLLALDRGQTLGDQGDDRAALLWSAYALALVERGGGADHDRWYARTNLALWGQHLSRPGVAIAAARPVQYATFFPDSRSFLAAHSYSFQADDRVARYDAASGSVIRTYPGAPDGLVGLAGSLGVSSDGRTVRVARGTALQLATGVDPDVTQIRDAGTGLVLATFKDPPDVFVNPPVPASPRNEKRFDRRLRRLVTWENKGAVQVLKDAQTGKTLGQLKVDGLPDTFQQLAQFSDGGEVVAVGSGAGLAGLWDAETGRPLPLPQLPAGEALLSTKFSLSPDGSEVVALTPLNTLARYDTRTGKRVGEPFRVPPGLPPGEHTPVISRDGRWVRLVAAPWILSDSHVVAAYSLADGTPWPHPGVDPDLVSPDGTVGLRHPRQLVDLRTGRALGGPLPGGAFSETGTLHFSRDSRVLVNVPDSFGATGTVRMYDARSGRRLGPVPDCSGVGLDLAGDRVITVTKPPPARRDLAPPEEGLPTPLPVVPPVPFVAPVRPPLPPAPFVAPVAPPLPPPVVVPPLPPAPPPPLSPQYIRTWRLAPVEGTPERVTLWAQVVTGMELNAAGQTRPLSPVQVAERKRRLDQLGGDPLPK